MRRLSTIFLVCFLAVLASLSGVVAWRVMARRTPATVQQPAPQAEYQIKEVHINETLDGNLRWSLNADQAEVYEKKGITLMRNVVIQVFSRDGDWTVTSDEGTDNLAWQNERRTLHTDDAVEIRREGTTITGRGLSVHMKEETAALDRNVRVVITDRTKSNLALFPRSKP